MNLLNYLKIRTNQPCPKGERLLNMINIFNKKRFYHFPSATPPLGVRGLFYLSFDHNNKG